MLTATRFKLEEANYFLKQIEIAAEDCMGFTKLIFNLDAFLSASRSVTFFMQKEFSKHPKFEKWYPNIQEEMANDEDFKFFNNLRSKSIHESLVMPPERLTILTDPDDRPTDRMPKHTHLFLFTERRDADAVTLCRNYLKKIENIVVRWEKELF